MNYDISNQITSIYLISISEKSVWLGIRLEYVILDLLLALLSCCFMLLSYADYSADMISYFDALQDQKMMLAM